MVESNGSLTQDAPLQMHKAKLNSTDLDLEDEHGMFLFAKPCRMLDYV